MEHAALNGALTAEQDQRITETVERQRARLRNFIRRRVADAADAEDILQEVFYELVEAYRMMQPLEQVSAWLFRVARNRITDLFRKKKPESFAKDPIAFAEDGEPFSFEDLLPSPNAGPDAEYARNVLFEEFEAAVDELPAEQRERPVIEMTMQYVEIVRHLTDSFHQQRLWRHGIAQCRVEAQGARPDRLKFRSRYRVATGE